MNECKTERKAIVPIGRHVTHKYGFVESLSSDLCDEMRDPDAINFIKKFKTRSVKEELLQKVFLIFNDNIFDGKVNLKVNYKSQR